MYGVSIHLELSSPAEGLNTASKPHQETITMSSRNEFHTALIHTYRVAAYADHYIEILDA